MRHSSILYKLFSSWFFCLGQPISVSQLGRSRLGDYGWARQQQPALTLSCLSSSINICWPGNMVSLLILMYPPNGLQGGWISTVGISCPVALLNIPMSSLEITWTFQSFADTLFSPSCFSSWFLCAAPLPSPPCLLVLFVLLCHTSSGWKPLCCVCIPVMWALVMIPTYSPSYTLNWMYRSFWSSLRFHEQWRRTLRSAH